MAARRIITLTLISVILILGITEGKRDITKRRTVSKWMPRSEQTCTTCTPFNNNCGCLDIANSQQELGKLKLHIRRLELAVHNHYKLQTIYTEPEPAEDSLHFNPSLAEDSLHFTEATASKKNKSANASKSNTQTIVQIDNKARNPDKTYPWTETKVNKKPCTPTTTKTGGDLKIYKKTSKMRSGTLTSYTTDLVSHYKSICVTQEIETKTTHWEDRDVIDVVTTTNTVETTWSETSQAVSKRKPSINQIWKYSFEGSNKRIKNNSGKKKISEKKIEINNKAIYKGKTFPWSETKTAKKECKPKVVKTGQDTKVDVKRQEYRSRMTKEVTTTDAITYYKASCASGDIETRTTHYKDRDIVKVFGTKYTEEITWSEIHRSVKTKTLKKQMGQTETSVNHYSDVQKSNKVSKNKFQKAIEINNKAIYPGKTFPFSDTKVERKPCKPTTTKTAEQLIIYNKRTRTHHSTITEYTTDVISHYKSICVTQDIETKTTHWENRDVIEVVTTDNAEESTWSATRRTISHQKPTISQIWKNYSNKPIKNKSGKKKISENTIQINNKAKYSGKTFPWSDSKTVKKECKPKVVKSNEAPRMDTKRIDHPNRIEEIKTVDVLSIYRASCASGEIETRTTHWADKDVVEKFGTDYTEEIVWSEINSSIKRKYLQKPIVSTSNQSGSTQSKPQVVTSVKPDNGQAKPQVVTSVKPDNGQTKPQVVTSVKPDNGQTKPQVVTSVKPENGQAKPQVVTSVKPDNGQTMPQVVTSVKPDNGQAKPQVVTSVKSDNGQTKPQVVTANKPDIVLSNSVIVTTNSSDNVQTSEKTKTNKVSKQVTQRIVKRNNKAISSDKTFPWSETKVDKKACIPTTRKPRNELKIYKKTREMRSGTITVYTMNLISHFTSICTTQDIETKTTHWEDRDVIDVVTTTNTEETTWSETRQTISRKKPSINEIWKKSYENSIGRIRSKSGRRKISENTIQINNKEKNSGRTFPWSETKTAKKECKPTASKIREETKVDKKTKDHPHRIEEINTVDVISYYRASCGSGEISTVTIHYEDRDVVKVYSIEYIVEINWTEINRSVKRSYLQKPLTSTQNQIATQTTSTNGNKIATQTTSTNGHKVATQTTSTNGNKIATQTTSTNGNKIATQTTSTNGNKIATQTTSTNGNKIATQTTSSNGNKIATQTTSTNNKTESKTSTSNSATSSAILASSENNHKNENKREEQQKKIINKSESTNANQVVIIKDNKNQYVDKVFPWSEMSEETKGCIPKVTKTGEETKVHHDTQKQESSTIKTTTTDVISHYKSVCVSQNIRTTTTHHEDKDVMDVVTTEYTTEETWDEIQTTVETETETETESTF